MATPESKIPVGSGTPFRWHVEMAAGTTSIAELLDRLSADGWSVVDIATTFVPMPRGGALAIPRGAKGPQTIDVDFVPVTQVIARKSDYTEFPPEVAAAMIRDDARIWRLARTSED